jgi:hypothetical protein
MRKALFVAAALIVMFPLLAAARGHSNDNGQQSQHERHHSNGSHSSGSGRGGTGGGTPAPTPTPPPVVPPTPPIVPPVVVPPIVTPPTAGEIRYQAYTTGYAALDNTPSGSTQIDLGGHSGNAGGTGTYADPITLAVGHSIVNGQDIGDYPYGTKWYVPNLRKYFTAADSCGDGNSPQSGPCHTGYQGHVWLDLYVGASLQNAVLSCEDSVTDLHLVIQNPSPNYAVVSGAVFDTGCVQYGDAVI